MTNAVERVNLALEEIALAISRITLQGHRLELNQLSQPYKGWVDGRVGRYYYTIFDLQSEGGKKYRKKFWDSTNNSGTDFDFSPTSSFRVKGRQVSSGDINELEWYILETTAP